jgi:hypothetical protein
VRHVIIGDGTAQLDFDRDDPLVRSFDDQVDLLSGFRLTIGHHLCVALVRWFIEKRRIQA